MDWKSVVEQVTSLKPGRVIVVLAALVFVGGLLVSLLHRDADALTAVSVAFLPALLTMVILSVGRRLWRGEEPTQIDASADGVSLQFDEQIASTTGLINDRVTELTTQVNERLLDLERQVFKQRATSDDAPGEGLTGGDDEEAPHAPEAAS